MLTISMPLYAFQADYESSNTSGASVGSNKFAANLPYSLCGLAGITDKTRCENVSIPLGEKTFKEYANKDIASFDYSQLDADELLQVEKKFTLQGRNFVIPTLEQLQHLVKDGEITPKQGEGFWSRNRFGVFAPVSIGSVPSSNRYALPYLVANTYAGDSCSGASCLVEHPFVDFMQTSTSTGTTMKFPFEQPKAVRVRLHTSGHTADLWYNSSSKQWENGSLRNSSTVSFKAMVAWESNIGTTFECATTGPRGTFRCDSNNIHIR
ncbi:hypothetical protein [Enterovibrio coralii]|uniref:hypothetical protein n=1 Tax=Enterovibrio coralii TaxID=294935 RepID=UPI001E320ABF|nr:hypothetical protein [Enterovibrio coralii]